MEKKIQAIGDALQANGLLTIKPLNVNNPDHKCILKLLSGGYLLTFGEKDGQLECQVTLQTKITDGQFIKWSKKLLELLFERGQILKETITKIRVVSKGKYNNALLLRKIYRESTDQWIVCCELI